MFDFNSDPTQQEIFDHVWNSMVKQGVRSSSINEDNEEFCRYRSPEGLSCAVGCLVDDDLAFRLDKFETPCIDSIVTRSKNEGFLPNFIVKNVDLLERLQFSHDQQDDPDKWLKSFQADAKRAANYYNLTVPQ